MGTPQAEWRGGSSLSRHTGRRRAVKRHDAHNDFRRLPHQLNHPRRRPRSVSANEKAWSSWRMRLKLGGSMRKRVLLSTANAVVLACGGEDLPGPGERHLAFTVQPSTTVAGQVMTPAVQVSVEDAAGNPLTSGTAAITLTLHGSTSTGSVAALNGQTTRTASNGVAVFSDLSITKPGSSYSLRATASGIDGAASTTFAVLPPAHGGHLAF